LQGIESSSINSASNFPPEGEKNINIYTRESDRKYSFYGTQQDEQFQVKRRSESSHGGNQVISHTTGVVPTFTGIIWREKSCLNIL
jgi:hypothetical protein